MALFGFGRIRRRRASAGSVFFGVLVGLGLFGYDHLCDKWQESEAFSGQIVRKYSEKPFFNNRSTSLRYHYWDVESADGKTHTLRIRPESAWASATEGEWVIKRQGELNPERIGGKITSRRR